MPGEGVLIFFCGELKTQSSTKPEFCVTLFQYLQFLDLDVDSSPGGDLVVETKGLGWAMLCLALIH